MATSKDDQPKADETFGLKFFLDKGLAVIPLFVSTVAISFDVGTFVSIGLGYFTFFSLTENLLFALEALPFAMLLSFFGIVTLPAVSFLHQVALASSQKKQLNSGKPIIPLVVFLISLFGFFGICIAVVHWLPGARPMMVAAIVIMFPFVMIWANQVFLMRNPKVRDFERGPLQAAALVLYAILAASFSLGVAAGAGALDDDEGKSVVALKDDRLPMRGKILRSGERGLLFYEAASRVVRFERWDAIRAVETKRI